MTARAMSPADKNNIMKSTLKIDYASNSESSVPVIKIIQPAEIWNDTHHPDFDVRDKLIRDLLVRPGFSDRNYWFELRTCFGNDIKEPTVFISEICAVREEVLIKRFKYAILNRYVPYNSLRELNQPVEVGACHRKDIIGIEKYTKIKEFFEWLENTSTCSYGEQQGEFDSCATRP